MGGGDGWVRVVPSDYFVSTQLQLWLFCCLGCDCCWAVTISRSVGCKVENLTCTLIKKQMKYCPVPENQQWRVDVLRDLQELKWNIIEIDGFLEDEELGDLIENLVVS